MLKIYNLIAQEMPNTNGDVYSGSFTDESGEVKCLYMIAFKEGTKARGHEVIDIKAYLVESDKLREIVTAEALAIIKKEVLKGF